MLLTAYKRAILLFDRLCFLVFARRFDVIGRENAPAEGPLIVASNHLNNADPPVLALAFSRFPVFMAKREMMSWPILGLGFRAFGAFPVSRGGADLSAIRAATEIVNEGNMLVMFPEGTRSRTGGLTKGHPGTALIALRTGAPILPAAITGTEQITWPWVFIKPFGIKHLTVTLGEPFTLEPVEKINSEAATEATKLIMRKIAELLPPEYRGVYADTVEEAANAPMQG